MPTQPSRKLVTFPNPRPGRDYVIRHVCPEYTALCPVTGQPDFGTIVVQYVPDARCVELKSLKLYLWSFRDEGHFFEDVTNRILDDLVKAMRPKRIRVTGRFAVRGGIWTRVVARWDAPGARDTAPVRGRGRGPLRAGSGTATRAGAARRRAR